MNERSQNCAMARASTPRCVVVARRHGFTLIELLVVMAIIGLLVGLLMPALSAARQQARKTRAKAEVRQMVVAMTAYMNDNSGATPTVEQIRGKYMEIKPGPFVDPWKNVYVIKFVDSKASPDLIRTYQTRAFIYNYNRGKFGDEPQAP